MINDELALTEKANIHFTRSVKEGERVVAKAKVSNPQTETGRAIVKVRSYVGQELVFYGEFTMFRSKSTTKDEEL